MQMLFSLMLFHNLMLVRFFISQPSHLVTSCTLSINNRLIPRTVATAIVSTVATATALIARVTIARVSTTVLSPTIVVVRVLVSATAAAERTRHFVFVSPAPAIPFSATRGAVRVGGLVAVPRR